MSKEEKESIERWRKLGACVDKPEEKEVGAQVKDGINIKTYAGNNVWTKTLLHEGKVDKPE